MFYKESDSLKSLNFNFLIHSLSLEGCVGGIHMTMMGKTGMNTDRILLGKAFEKCTLQKQKIKLKSIIV